MLGPKTSHLEIQPWVKLELHYSPLGSAVEEGLNNIKIEGDSQVVMVISAVLTRATTGVEIRPFYL
jgi:hypothetical protein